MRLILVGPPQERSRLRARLEDAGLEIVDEFATLSAARRAAADVDGFFIARSADTPIPLDDDPDIDRDALVDALTEREREVLDLLAEGLPNKAIAARLGISDQTVKFHVASIYGKLGVSNRTEAVRRGVRKGLVTL